MPRIPELIKLLENIKEIHEKKNQDYAGNNNPFENFERSAELISWFIYSEDKAFVSLIATKLARLATLLSKNEAPNNESIADSFLDLTTYCALWASFHASKKLSPEETASAYRTAFGLPEPFQSKCNHHWLKTTSYPGYQCGLCGWRLTERDYHLMEGKNAQSSNKSETSKL